MASPADGELRVRHADREFDVTRFARFHPGGSNSLTPFKGKDVTAKMADYEHSPAAMYLMQEFRLPGQQAAKGEPEDLEHLVDWSRPMLPQVATLGTKYYEWVSSPVDRPLRLFESNLLEMLTVTPWYLVPGIWLPVAAMLFYHGLVVQNPDGISAPSVAAILVGGVLFWTLLEYTLHRWLFHRKPNPSKPWQLTMHFTIHGLHHKVPFDSTRLLFPPVPAGIVIVVIYVTLSLVLPTWLPSLLGAGALVGYVCYDLIHFYLHYGSPQPTSYFYHMKRYHNRHHFTHSEEGFGISSDLWDRVFGTTIMLNKLKKVLKW